MSSLDSSLRDLVDHDTRRVIEAGVSRQLENVLYSIENESDVPTDWRDTIHSWDFDDAIVYSLSLEQRLSLVETFGDEFGLVLGDVSWLR